MTSSSPLTERGSHFDFGKNWASYAADISEEKIDEAVIGMRRLVGDSLNGKTFLDIGCGSGLHSLAALRLGAASVSAIDLDGDSVRTTRDTLTRFAPASSWTVSETSVFDLALAPRKFDVVYSWGVLHHTGDMYRAIECAAAAVSPGGIFAFALYRRTRLCWAWKVEKRWYARTSVQRQRWMQRVYTSMMRLAMRIRGQELADYVASYKSNRGMDYHHDVHDWLGGWPYESIAPDEVQKRMTGLGFVPVRVFAQTGISLGMFGSGCDEYIYRNDTTPSRRA